jgi:phenylalanyl-tRNA synthetase alpha chain
MSDTSTNDELASLLKDFRAQLADVGDEAGLYDLQVRFLGKKGSISLLRRGMGKLDPDARKAFGQAFNRAKQEAEAMLEARRTELLGAARDAELSRFEDLSTVQAGESVGSLHPITRTRRELERIFRVLGFDVAEGPHVESEVYNFDKLNILAGHPARDMQDTFFVHPRGQEEGKVDEGDGLVLRTHTSPVQVRTMLNQQPPIRIVAPGTVFRRDDDATHSPMFHQIEGLYVDRGVTMADLKATLYRFVKEFFGDSLELRFRPSYFPFVEPGAEFDVECPFCKRAPEAASTCSVCRGSGWIELGGSGMVHPEVFRGVGIDPEVYSGWAFGFGIDRMAMLRYGVPHLRIFFEGDLRFVEQFPC